jgi:ribosomal protein L37E
MSKLLRREPTQEAPCPRCGVSTPVDADDCTACGWDMRESYHGPVGMHELAGSERRSDG